MGFVRITMLEAYKQNSLLADFPSFFHRTKGTAVQLVLGVCVDIDRLGLELQDCTCVTRNL